MKSRFIRALTVGAALLIPVGSVAVLGSSSAGAVTKLLAAGSGATLPTVGTITLAGITLNYTGTNTASNRPISPTLKAAITAKDTTTPGVFKILSGAKVTLAGVGTQAAKNGCVITINKVITLTFTSPNQLTGSVIPTAAQVTVTGCAGGITATIKGQIAGKAIKIKLI